MELGYLGPEASKSLKLLSISSQSDVGKNCSKIILSHLKRSKYDDNPQLVDISPLVYGDKDQYDFTTHYPIKQLNVCYKPEILLAKQSIYLD